MFHTVEGGCIICNDSELKEKLFLFRSFGHKGDDYFSVGINGKNSEFHAAMGLALLPHLPLLIKQRKDIFDFYSKGLANTGIEVLNISNSDIQWNYSYFPILFKSEIDLLLIKAKLEEQQIFIRRYFYPSLNKLPFLKEKIICENSELLASKIAALPLYPGLTLGEINQIVNIIITHTQ